MAMMQQQQQQLHQQPQRMEQQQSSNYFTASSFHQVAAPADIDDAMFKVPQPPTSKRQQVCIVQLANIWS